MKCSLILAVLLIITASQASHSKVKALNDPANRPGESATKAKNAVNSAARAKLKQQMNSRLLAESRKNQCSFKTDTDRLEPGCDRKFKNLANVLITAKKAIQEAGVLNFKFVVSCHTDTRGNATQNKELTNRRARVIAEELVLRGIKRDEIVSRGRGSEQPIVKPDNTPAKQAKNRRYEISVEF